MLLSSYNHEPLSGECFEDSGQGLSQQQQEMLPSSGGALANCSMQEHGLKAGSNSDQGGGPARALRIKPQPNQVLKCPRCNSLNTKFCYYNNYSLTQPRHFCKNCRRYWTKGGALRNVPVGGGCRKNKRAKQKSSEQSSGVSGASDKAVSGSSFGNENLPGSRHGQLLAASTSGLYDLAAAKEEDGIGLNPYARIPHTLRLGDHHPGTSSSGLSFEIPIHRAPQAPGGMTFSSLPINLPGFEAAGLSTATLNFQGLMKHENGGEFTPIYDPSLNLLGGGGGGGGPPVSAAAPVQLSEGLSSFNIGLESFVGLGLNGDLKWRQAHQPNQKIATLVDAEQGQDQGIHHHHHHGHHHQSLLQLDESESSMRPASKASLKSALAGLAAAQDQVHEQQQQAAHSSGDWQGQQQQQQQQQHQQHHHHQQQQQQEFMEATGDGATYWNSTGWPIDLPIYVDHQQYCDVKPVEQAVPDFYSRATSMSRCTPSLT